MRNEILEAELPAYEEAMGRAVRLGIKDAETNGGYFGQLMQSPDLGFRISQIGRIVRAAGDTGRSFRHVDREWVNQVLAVELNSEIVQGGHLPDALSAGVRLEGIKALRAGRDEDLTDNERDLTLFIRHVLNGTMTAQAWQAVEARLGERGAVEYSIFVLFLQFTMRLMRAMSPNEGMTKSEVEAMIDDFEHGRRDLPDYRDRIK